MAVAVVTDSVACLPPDRRAELGIGMVGVPITLDGRTYRDSIELSSEEFFARLDDVASHTTAAPSVGDWVTEFERVVAAGADGLLVTCVAAKLSGTFDAAWNAIRLVSVPAVAVDSRTAAAAQSLYVRRLAEEAKAGVPLDELVARAERRRGAYHARFALAGLDRLARSGRMPAAMARLGDAADLKPMVQLGETGEVRPAGVIRGLSRAIDRLVRDLLEVFPAGAPGRVIVSHALLEDEAEELAARLRDQRPELEVEISLFSPVMGANTGPIVGVGWEDPAVAAEAG